MIKEQNKELFGQIQSMYDELILGDSNFALEILPLYRNGSEDVELNYKTCFVAAGFDLGSGTRNIAILWDNGGCDSLGNQANALSFDVAVNSLTIATIVREMILAYASVIPGYAEQILPHLNAYKERHGVEFVDYKIDEQHRPNHRYALDSALVENSRSMFSNDVVKPLTKWPLGTTIS